MEERAGDGARAEGEGLVVGKRERARSRGEERAWFARGLRTLSSAPRSMRPLISLVEPSICSLTADIFFMRKYEKAMPMRPVTMMSMPASPAVAVVVASRGAMHWRGVIARAVFKRARAMVSRSRAGAVRRTSRRWPPRMPSDVITCHLGAVLSHNGLAKRCCCTALPPADATGENTRVQLAAARHARRATRSTLAITELLVQVSSPKITTVMW